MGENEELQQLADQIREVQGEILEVVFQMDEINLRVNPQIRAEYAIRIGCWQNELLKAQIDARKARRRYDLAKMLLNNNGKIDETDIQQHLLREFTAWETQLKVQTELYTKSLELRSETDRLSEDEKLELTRLYHQLIERLHPHLHREFTAEQERLFQLAQTAFERSDLAMLRSLLVSTHDLDEPNGVDPENESFEELNVELEFAQAHLSVMQEQLAELKGSSPYNLRQKLNDPQWVDETIEGLQKEIEHQKQEVEKYTNRYNVLLESES